MENNKQETHICKWCKAETWQSDDECYANPKNKPMSNNKQTAVEWLEEKLDRIGLNANIIGEYIKQAKEMEKQQIIDATCLNEYVNEDDREIGERYYKEEYGNET